MKGCCSQQPGVFLHSKGGHIPKSTSHSRVGSEAAVGMAKLGSWEGFWVVWEGQGWMEVPGLPW